MSLEIEQQKTKAVKELELMAKKIKKRMSHLENNLDVNASNSIVLLSQEYRQIKETIIRILTN